MGARSTKFNHLRAQVIQTSEIKFRIRVQATYLECFMWGENPIGSDYLERFLITNKEMVAISIEVINV